MLTGWGMTAFRIEPKNRLLSGSTTRDSVNPKSLIFDALSGQANSHRLLQRAISFFFCESAIAALASLQARHCTLHYGTLRIVSGISAAGSRTAHMGRELKNLPQSSDEAATSCNTIRMQGPQKTSITTHIQYQSSSHTKHYQAYWSQTSTQLD